MIPPELEAKYDRVVQAIGDVLTPLGYRKGGASFRKLRDGNAAIVNLQRSKNNGPTRISFTLNAAVCCGPLMREEDPPLAKAHEWHGQLRLRPGQFLVQQRRWWRTFLPPSHDRWWVLAPGIDAESVAQDVAGLVERRIAPFLEGHLSTDALLEYWETTPPTGRFDPRARYIEKLRWLKQQPATGGAAS